MKDRTKIRTGKRIMAVMLSLAMIFGIFSGMKLDAEAAGTMYSFDDLQVGKELYFGDTINFDLSKADSTHNFECRLRLYNRKQSLSQYALRCAWQILPIQHKTSGP